jgi:hypothetical protein
VTSAALEVAEHRPWLSQGDIFAKVLIPEVGIADSRPQVGQGSGPALLVTHDCTIDKKRTEKSRKVSKLEYLTFLPIHDAAALPPQRREALVATAGDLPPYDALYLGEVDGIGDAYVSLVHPYSLPALLLRTELKEFTAEETGEDADTRIIASIGDTRVGRLNPERVALLQAKWIAVWTRQVGKPTA